MEIVSSKSPSYIKAKVGSWFSMSSGNERGQVRADIGEGRDGSYVNLNFDFSITYLGGFVFGLIGALFIYFILNGLLSPAIYSELWLFLTLFVCLSFLVAPAIIAWDVDLTKKKFLNEFNMFIQSLSSRKRNG